MRPLTRRGLLRTIAGTVGVSALGGCITGGRLRRYRVINDAIPDALPATLSATAVATPTEERPLVIEISFESTAGEPTTFAIDPPGTFPFGRTTVENRAPLPTEIEGVSATPHAGPRRVTLSDTDAGVLVDQCWTATDDSNATTEGDHRVRLAPGESVSVERAVLNYAENPTCYPIGVYRFTEAFRFKSSNAPENGSAVKWGFSLEISDLRPD